MAVKLAGKEIGKRMLPKLGVCKVLDWLEKYTASQGFEISGLHEAQKQAFRLVIQGTNIFVAVRTAGGKTLMALICLYLALIRGQIGVYLVPHNQLLFQKLGQIRKAFGDAAHVIYLAGEIKPSLVELQENEGKLIIVATYEAFRNFLFQVQNRKYFSASKCFGVVVIDEIHMLQDPSRGLNFETMIYKLRDEYQPQFCFLSGSFEEESAMQWSSRFGCHLIYYNPARIFKFREIERAAPNHWEALPERIEKAQKVLEEFIEAHEDTSFIPPKLIPGKVLIFCHSRASAEATAIAIIKKWGLGTEIYCDYIHAGLAREEQRKIFAEFNRPDGIRILCSSPLLETGVDIPAIELIIITDPEHYSAIRLAQMCGRTREEEGEVVFLIHFHDREEVLSKLILNEEKSKIVGFNFERIESQISQRGIDLSTIYRLILETLFRHQLSRAQIAKKLQKYNLMDVKGSVWGKREKWPELAQILFEEFFEKYLNKQQMTLEEVETPVLNEEQEMEEISQLLTEALVEQTEQAPLPPPPLEETIEFNLKEVLQYLLNNMLIWRSGGRYALTYIGMAVVESGLRVKDAVLCIQLFIMQELGSSILKIIKGIQGTEDLSQTKAERERFSLHYRNLLANLITKKSLQEPSIYAEEPDATWIVEKWRAVWWFIRQYNALQPKETDRYREKFGISEGDAEMHRRTAIWLASSLYKLYDGLKLHQLALEMTPTHYYLLQNRFLKQSYITQDPKKQESIEKSLRQSRLMKRRLQRLIERFQKERKEYPVKPWSRPHPIHISKSNYSKYIIEVLKKRRQQGTTIKEIQQLLKEKRKKAREENKLEQLQELNQLSFSTSSIHTILNHTLKGRISKKSEHIGAAHRPATHYWLTKFKPSKTETPYCKECDFFSTKATYQTIEAQEKTHCKKRKVCDTGLQAICPDFRRKNKPLLLIHDFDVLDGEVRCPQCGRYGTVRIPTFQRMSICVHCGVLLWQVRLGRYAGRRNVQIPEYRKKEEGGFLFVELESKKRKIFLKTGETLNVRGAKKTDIPIISIAGRKENAYFLDEVELIILAGGTIGTGRNILERHGIQITPPFTEEQLKRLEQKEAQAQELRAALTALTSERLFKKAGDLIAAKMLSNIYYTFKIGQIIPKDQVLKKPFEDLALKQYDYLTRLLLILKEKSDLNSPNTDPLGLTSNSEELNAPTSLDISPSNSQQISLEKFLDRLRSQEGNAEIAAWEAIKQALPSEFQFKGRQIRRSVRSVLFRGVKALDPFNSALNYLYSLLSEQISDALSTAGFDKYFPGPGLIHRRHRSKTALSGIDRKENHELLYDFMDTYRAPFRFYLLLAFQQNSEFQNNLAQEFSPALTKWYLENSITKKDFKSTSDEWHRRIYTLNKRGKPKMDLLFQLICAESFSYQNEMKTLQEIISTEAKDFAAFLLQKSENHTPFRASDQGILEDKILHYFHQIKEMMESHEPRALPPLSEQVPSLLHASICQTIYGKTFGTLIFRDFFDSRNVKGFLKIQIPSLPDFLICLWPNQSLNFRVFNKEAVNLLGLLKRLGMQEPQAIGTIYPPRQTMYRAKSTSLYIYRPIDALINLISNSNLTKRLADLFPEKVIRIPAKKLSIPLWTFYEGTFEISETGEWRDLEPAPYDLPLPQGGILRLPTGHLLLLFADWKDYRTLFSFLHFLLLSYQLNQQKLSSSPPPKIIYLDTTKITLNFEQLIALSAPLPNLESIIFTSFANFLQLRSFINESLSTLIRKINAEIVILNLPFDLIKAEDVNIIGTAKFSTKKAKTNAEFIQELKEVALNTKVNIILTSLGTTFDQVSEKTIPNLPKAVNLAIEPKVYLKHSLNHFELEVQEETDALVEYLEIPLPIEKRKEEIALADFCILQESIDFSNSSSEKAARSNEI